MSDSFFIGRKHELDRLNGLHNKKLSALAVIQGRRRIGKSRLVAEFASKHANNRFWSFAGLGAQSRLQPQEQRDHFSTQLALMLGLPEMAFLNWTYAFEYLSLHLNPGGIVLFDEISWMGSDDPTFIPKLKAWWDKQSKHVVLVLCGSVSTWIEENILNSTAFFGRIDLTIALEPLSIGQSVQFLKNSGMQISDYDTYKLLSILGGIPWYLKQLDRSFSADENIKNLAFEKKGLLVSEFDRIFYDLFNTRGTTYKKILEALKDGTKTLAEIRDSIHFPHSGTLSQIIENLIIAGFVNKQALWSFKTVQPLKQSLYRLSDTYIRFYLKMIQPNRESITSGSFRDTPLSTMPGFDAHMGLQLEQLLLQNRLLILKALHISAIDVLHSGPYRQTATRSQKGCQIDCLIQTATKTLFVCEFKFKRNKIDTSIVQEMQTKLSALRVPKGYATVPVLFYLGDVSASVATSSYFYRVIDIADFLNSEG